VIVSLGLSLFEWNVFDPPVFTALDSELPTVGAEFVRATSVAPVSVNQRRRAAC
jgi:hypothetical protein